MKPSLASSRSGYTLIELSLVLGILALLLAGAMAVVTQNIRRSNTQELNRKMDILESRLLDFARANGRLPCPADSSMLVSQQYFGVEGVATGVAATTCLNGSTYTNGTDLGGSTHTPDASFYDGTNTVGGDIPVKTLGLSDDYMFDPWGGRFFYAIDKRMTTTGAFTTYPPGSAIGSITVNDGNLNPKITNAVAIVISFGPDGHGAFSQSGARKVTYNINANTLTNCNCDSSSGNTIFGATYVQAPSTSTSTADQANFDDIVRYYTRQSFLTSADVSANR